MEITNNIPTDPPANPTCERCGRDAAAVIDDKGWCVDCFHESGSCCAGEE